jgi:hypothetical protein
MNLFKIFSIQTTSTKFANLGMDHNHDNHSRIEKIANLTYDCPDIPALKTAIDVLAQFTEGRAYGAIREIATTNHPVAQHAVDALGTIQHHNALIEVAEIALRIPATAHSAIEYLQVADGILGVAPLKMLGTTTIDYTTKRDEETIQLILDALDEVFKRTQSNEALAARHYVEEVNASQMDLIKKMAAAYEARP